MDHSTPGLPVHQQLPKFTQTHVQCRRENLKSTQNLTFFTVLSLVTFHRSPSPASFVRCFKYLFLFIYLAGQELSCGMWTLRFGMWIQTRDGIWPPSWKSGVLATGPPGKSYIFCFKYICIYFWLHWLFGCYSWASSSCGKWGPPLLLVCQLLTAVPFLVAEHLPWAPGLQYLRHTGLVALRPVGSSPTRNQTSVPCIGRWILNHWTTREVPHLLFFF